MADFLPCRNDTGGVGDVRLWLVDAQRRWEARLGADRPVCVMVHQSLVAICEAARAGTWLATTPVVGNGGTLVGEVWLGLPVD